MTIHKTGYVAILGLPNSGKSTLLGLMAGLDTATSGDVVLDGQSLNAMDEEQRAVLRGHRLRQANQPGLDRAVDAAVQPAQRTEHGTDIDNG